MSSTRNMLGSHKERSRPRSPADEWRTNWLGKMFFSWITPLLVFGFSNTIQAKDLGELADCDLSSQLLTQLKADVERELAKPRPKMHWPFHRLVKNKVILAGFCKLIGDLLGFVPPLMLTALVTFAEETQANGGVMSEHWGIPTGYWYAMAMFASSFIQRTILHQHHHLVIRAGMHARIAAQVLVVDKSLRQPASTIESSAVQNLQSNDATKIQFLYYFIHYTWAAPLQVIISLVLLYMQLQWAAFLGVAVMALLTPIQGLIVKRVHAISGKIMKATDKRVEFVTQVLQGIRIVKFNAWEDAFIAKIREHRDDELKYKRQSAIIGAFNTLLLDNGPLLVGLVTFLTYGYISDEELTAPRAFTALALFSVLRLPLIVMPMLTGAYVEASVAWGRLRDYMQKPDLEPYLEHTERSDEVAISLQNATLAWHGTQSLLEKQKAKEEAEAKEEADKAAADKAAADKAKSGGSREAGDAYKAVMPAGDSAGAGQGAGTADLSEEDARTVLHNITVDIPRGKFTTIVGHVGASKTSFLAALMGELQLVSGKVLVRNVKGSTVASCPQVPWIQNATVRDNIVFGAPFDAQRYARVLEACVLDVDLETLAKGDETEIGERGINLSGGQKARVALARAVYSTAPLVLLDDVLSAVDAHTARKLVDRVIQTELAGRTVVLVSHQLQFLNAADHIVVLDKGRVMAQGTFAELTQPGGAAYSDNLKAMLDALAEEAKAEEETPDEELVMEDVDNGAGAGAGAAGDVVRARQASSASRRRSRGASVVSTTGGNDKAASTDGTLVTTEEREEGAVAAGVYWRYTRAFGCLGVLVIVLWLILTNGLKVLTDAWLSEWSTRGPDHSVDYWIGVYAGIIAVNVVVSGIGNIAWVLSALRAARSMHDGMLIRILRAPTSFFDTTPVGRLLNRFGPDILFLDKQLPDSFRSAITMGFTLVAIVIMMIIVMPWAAIGFVPTLLLYFFTQEFYRRSSREIKRVDSISRSPVFSHLEETLAGLDTIRSFSAQQRFLDTATVRVDNNTKAFWKLNLINRWLGVRLDALGTIIMSIVALVGVIQADTLNAGLLGLALTYGFSSTDILNWTVRMWTETETLMNSVERIMHYSKVEVEADAIVPGNRPGANWPSKGAISIKNLSMRYRKGLDLVLKNVSVDIAAGDKVGICGRTGSGKSSLLLALLRIVESEHGSSIMIDGVEARKIGLADLRSKIAVIPQDPVLFNGTIRSNLDPFNHHQPEELWRSLQAVHLDSRIEQQGKLDATVATNGSNFSVGERQLICMARALLRGAKIVLLDEATANIDIETDAMIQRMVKHELKQCTVLTIAHRMDTIRSSDKILVMDNGRVAEFGPPGKLLANADSEYRALVEESQQARGQALNVTPAIT